MLQVDRSARRAVRCLLGLMALSVDPTAGLSAFAQDAPPGAAGAAPDELEFANGLFRGRRYDLAAEEYEAFLKTNPDRRHELDARYGLANARHFLQEYAAAREQFEAFLKVAPADHPNAATAHFRVGELAYVLGDLPTARNELRGFLDKDPSHKYAGLALPYLGDVLFRLGDMDGAEAAYRKALSDHPNGRLADRARLYLGKTLVARGRSAEAEAVLIDLAGKADAAHRDEAWLELGRLRVNDGRPAEAIEAFEALERDSARSRLVPRARLARAEALQSLNRHDDAERLLIPLAADAASDVAMRAGYVLGVGRLARNQPAEALAAFDEALARSPQGAATPALHFRSAEALARLGQAVPARDRYARMAEDYPQDEWADDALLRAATLSLDADDPARAEALARQLIEGHPASPLRAGARVIEARAALASGRADDAAKLLNDALTKLDPDAATAQTARYYLGLAYKDAGRTEEAGEVLEALAAAPDAPLATDALYLVGQEHFDAGRYREAAESLEKYLSDRPDAAAADHALARLALSRSELDEADAARRALAQLEERFPKSELARMTRVRLGENAVQAEKWDLALDLLAPVGSEEGQPLRARALSGIGWAMLKTDDPAGAIDAFATLERIVPDGDPMAADAAYLGALALEQADRDAEAIAAYEGVVARHPTSKQAGAARLARARLLAGSGQAAEAAAAFRSSLESGAEPADVVLSELGWALLDSGDSEGADAAFGRIVAEFPDSPRAADARLNLAESAFRAGRMDDVETLLAPILESKAGEPKVLQSALYRLGRARAERKDWQAAGAAFDRLAADYPDGLYPREARFWAAESAYQAGDAATAEAGFASLADETSDAAEPWLATAHLRRIQALILLKRWDDVLTRAAALESAQPDHPQAAEIQYARGQAFQALARFDEAREALQRAIDARKGSTLAAQAQFLRGETFFHQKNYKSAVREFLKVDVLYDAPKWQALALLEAGKVFERLDQWSDAAQAYEKLLDDPTAPGATAREAAERLAVARQKQAATRR